MPLVRIDIMEGRPPEKIRELHGRVAALVAEILDTPIERVRTYITQFPPEGWGIGGVPAPGGWACSTASPARPPKRPRLTGGGRRCSRRSAMTCGHRSPRPRRQSVACRPAAPG